MTSKEYAPVETDAMDVEKEPYHPPMETPEYPVEQPTAPKPAPPGAVHKTSISHKKSASSRQRTCSNCGHISIHEAVPLDIYPPPRPQTHIHQQSFNFVGYVILIALVIFLTFVAIKYIA